MKVSVDMRDMHRALKIVIGLTLISTTLVGIIGVMRLLLSES
jgi:hypothetical protein